LLSFTIGYYGFAEFRFLQRAMITEGLQSHAAIACHYATLYYLPPTVAISAASCRGRQPPGFATFSAGFTLTVSSFRYITPPQTFSAAE